MLHLNVSLDYVARVQVADCLQVLGECLLWLVLDGVQLVAVFFADFSVYFSWELCTDSYTLRLLEQSFLE